MNGFVIVSFMEVFMEKKRVGQRSVRFLKPPHLAASASVVGKKEGEGPLHTYFDHIDETDLFGGQSWEEAESSMQKQAVELAIQKAGYTKEDMHYILAGDLLGQLIASAFGIAQTDIPFLGIYGACSTFAEGILLSSVFSAFAKKNCAAVLFCVINCRDYCGCAIVSVKKVEIIVYIKYRIHKNTSL